MMFQQVDPFSFLFREDLTAERPIFWTVAFPRTWGSLLRQAVMVQKGASLSSIPRLRQTIEPQLSLSSLHQAIRALFPELISIGRPNPGENPKADNGNDTASSPAFWLLSREPIAPQHLCGIVRAWFASEYPKSQSPELKPDDLKWEQCQLGPPRREIAVNGTARLTNWEMTHLWPQFLSLLVTGKECHLTSQKDGKDGPGITEKIRFRRYLNAPGEAGAELVSWPPLYHGNDAFSLYLRLHMQTIPFSPHPRLYCRVGLRRWVRPLTEVSLPWHENTTVVLVPPVPPLGMTGGPQTKEELEEYAARMALTTTQVERRPKGEKEKRWQWDWHGAVTAVLKSQVIEHWQSFPNPEEFCQSPPVFEEFPDHWLPALVYREGIRPANRIQPGVNPSHRRQLMDWLADVWQTWMCLEAPFQRFPQMSFPPGQDWEKVTAANTAQPHATESKTENMTLVDGETDEETDGETAVDKAGEPEAISRLPLRQLRPGCLLRALGKTGELELWLELYWQTDDMLARVPSVVANILAPPSTGEGRVTIRLAPKPLGQLGAPLDLPGDQARKQREREVETILASSSIPLSPDIPVLALIELQGREYFLWNRAGKPMSPASDPKNLLRRVFARHGRLTQFIEPPVSPDTQKTGRANPEKMEKEFLERIQHALLDLFRQMGVILTLPPPPHPNRNLTTVGMWIPSRPAPASQKKLSAPKERTYSSPLWVRIDSNSHQVKVWIHGENGRGEWQPYWKALLELAQNPDRALPWLASPTDVAGRLENFVTTYLGQIPGEVLLLVVMQNARQVWPQLKNELLCPQKLYFLTPQYPLDTRQCPGLCVVRLRTHENDETPEWVARRVPVGDQSGQLPFSQTDEEAPAHVSLFWDSWSSGLFRPQAIWHNGNVPLESNPLRVLFSIQDVPVQYAQRKYPRPLHKGGWNPQMLEMTFVLLPERGPDIRWWGTWIHRLREKSVQSTGATILPLPLHLAQLMEEYLLDETN